MVEATEGLPPGWMASWGSVPVTRLELIPGGSAVVRLADGGKEAFTWESNTWKTVEPLQNTVLRTIGTSPVQYQWESPSGWLVNFDAAGKITAGAHMVQFYTGLIYRGPELIGECVHAIRRRREGRTA